MKILKKTIPVIYGVMFSLILFLLFFLDNSKYLLKKEFAIPNIVILIVIIIPLFILLCIKKDKKNLLSDKKYYKYLIIIAIITFILQLIIMRSILFLTDWDPMEIRKIVDIFMNEGNLTNNYYLSVYPNNILLTAMIVAIKMIPFFGEKYSFLLTINCFIVCISGIVTSLTIKNITDKKSSLLSLAIIIPLIVLNPWFLIPYTDTISLFFISLIVYNYTKKDMKLLNIFLIGLFSIIGYYVKPTVIIVLISIIIVEIFKNFKIKMQKKELLNLFKIISVFMLGVLLAASINIMAKAALKFEQDPNVRKMSFVHYLAMGQNDKTHGAYDQTDIDNSMKYGNKYDLELFKKRLFNRNIKQQIDFFGKKTLLNYNDGTFGWGMEGTFFYEKEKSPNSFTSFVRDIYYSNGKYFKMFSQINQIIWLIVLCFCPFIIKKENNKKELVIMISIIGITMFLTIFEPRARYLYCYSELFVIAFIIGIINAREKIIKNYKKHKKKNS